MQPIDAYLMYCAMKAHFDKNDYDFVKYNGKSKVSRDSFYKRNDRIFFVKLTHKYKSKEDSNCEIIEFLTFSGFTRTLLFL